MRTALQLVLVLFIFTHPGVYAQESERISAELAESSPPLIPLKQALGEKVFNEAMASGKYQYAGNFKCRLCHRDFFMGRKQDVHDYAMGLLSQTNHEQTGRCLGCHSTGYGVKGGFKSLELTPRLANVQCEGCHGPGSVHISRNARGGFLAGTDRPEILKKMCLSCHSGRWNKSFDDFKKAYDGYKTAKPGADQEKQ